MKSYTWQTFYHKKFTMCGKLTGLGMRKMFVEMSAEMKHVDEAIIEANEITDLDDWIGVW